MKKLCSSLLAGTVALLITFSASAQNNNKIDSTLTAVIKVANLHCNNDMPTIKKQLLNQEGIDDVRFTDISSETSVFTVTYHSSVTTREQIEKAIESTPGCDNKKETPYRVKKESSRKKNKK